jgi:Histidine kinase-, DNA gyrase B-, and HSP90-like ATPase
VSREGLHQVLDNLIENALEASPTRSTVTVIATESDLRVRDEGPGLSPEQREHAFDRFWRVRAGAAPAWALPSSIGWSTRTAATSSYGPLQAAGSRPSCGSSSQATSDARYPCNARSTLAMTVTSIASWSSGQTHRRSRPLLASHDRCITSIRFCRHDGVHPGKSHSGAVGWISLTRHARR